MSAFILSQDHIDYLVTAAVMLSTGRDSTPIYWWQYPEHAQPTTVGSWNADEFGRMLLAENIASVRYRYPNDEYTMLPGPIPTPFAHEYTYRSFAPFRGREVHTIAQVLKTLACYEYQSCEHPGWEASSAKAICDNIRRAYISRIPGYDDAEWEVRRPTYATV